MTARVAPKRPVGRPRKPRTSTADVKAPAVPPKPPPTPVDTFIANPTPYNDKNPPDCDACWGVRQCTRGRIRQCRWCAADASENTQVPVQSKGKPSRG